MITWDKVSHPDRDRLVKRVLVDGEDLEKVANEIDIRPTTLSRRLREWRAKQRDSLYEQALKEKNEYTDGYARDLVCNYPEIEKGIISAEDAVRELTLAPSEVTTITFGDLTPGSNPEERMLFVNSDKPIRILQLTDTHFPFNDQRATDAFLRLASSVSYDMIVHAGDAWEMYGLSQFGKDQGKLFQNNVQTEKKSWYAFNDKLNSITNVKKLMVFGNHMARYIKWLHSNPAITWLEELQIDNIMRNEYYGWSPCVAQIMFNANINEPDFPNPELIIHHGTLARKIGGASSQGEALNFGYISSISGHVHRLAISYKRTPRGIVTMAEGGTLRTLRPEFMQYPDWQHGALYSTFVPGVGTFCEPVLIINGRCYYQGQEI